MSPEAVIVLIIVLAGLILFLTELLSVDLVALLLMISLVVTGVITPQEGLAGFANPATITVAFMFVLSEALLRTGVLQLVGPWLTRIFKNHPRMGLPLMMLAISLISAFMNNTPVVAVFIPIIAHVAHSTGIPSSKLLIPLSFASIFGGTCTLIGTSTNILVSGIADSNGLEPFSMFALTPLGIILLVVGMLYMSFLGQKLLPVRTFEFGLKDKFNIRNYLTEIEILPTSSSVGARIMDSPLVKELEMDIIEIRRNGTRFTLPQGDMILRAGDILKVRSDIQKIKELKDQIMVNMIEADSLRMADTEMQSHNTALVEMVVKADSHFEGKTLRQVDFRRSYRAVPIAIMHRQDVLHENLHEVRLKAGDVILAEAKRHYIKDLRELEQDADHPFILLSEEKMLDFSRRKFFWVAGVLAAVILTASIGLLPIVVATLAGTVLLVLTRTLSMKDVYESINWKIVFLMAGSISLGAGMIKSGLAVNIADLMIGNLGPWGPVAILSGLYLITSLLTELMSNTATAAFVAPIAIVTAQGMGLSPIPFLMAVTFAASASFMTPIGYQTNTMIYGAGGYRFTDFTRVGAGLTLLFWLLATFLIPVIYPF